MVWLPPTQYRPPPALGEHTAEVLREARTDDNVGAIIAVTVGQIARIEPYGPLTLDPATTVLHYGQAIFDGLKAFSSAK